MAFSMVLTTLMQYTVNLCVCVCVRERERERERANTKNKVYNSLDHRNNGMC